MWNSPKAVAAALSAIASIMPARSETVVSPT
jgi:hypothetical protein